MEYEVRRVAEGWTVVATASGRPVARCASEAEARAILEAATIGGVWPGPTDRDHPLPDDELSTVAAAERHAPDGDVRREAAADRAADEGRADDPPGDLDAG